MPAVAARPVTWAEIVALGVAPADARVAYGADSLQFGELRLPPGPGPFPTVVVVHGGCWRAQYDLAHVSQLAAALTREGLATWSIEYRRLGNAGGGWPGTFEDVARGVDHLRALAARYPLDTARVVLLGHSAGAQLALWAAGARARPGEPDAPRGATLPLRGVVSLAGITSLSSYGAAPGGCNAAVAPLLGGTPDEVPARYHAASPTERVPLGTRSRLVHGALDPIVPVEQSRSFVARASAAGEDAALLVVDGAGHFDLIAPAAPAWATVLRAVRELLLPPAR